MTVTDNIIPSVDNSFDLGTSDYTFRRIYIGTGLSYGEDCWIVIGGIAEVLIEYGTRALRSNWAKTSTTLGRADITTSPTSIGALTSNEHFK